MHLWRIRLHCFQHIDHWWQWLPLDLHEFQGILGDIATFGSHRDHCFSGIAHLVDSDCMLDDRLGTEGWQWIEPLGRLTASQYSMDARYLFGSAGIDPDDTGMSIGAA